MLYIDGVFACWTLEDQRQDKKVMHETRIPAGTYEITLRTVGSFHFRYSNQFPDIHKGSLWIRNVPGFEFILIHIGNTDNDSSGCILVGDTALQNVTNRGYIGDSTKAYKRIYPQIANTLTSGKKVTITIKDGI
jgi:hypothetical protein